MSKDKYKVYNWKAYNRDLKRRGSITLWVEGNVASHWKSNCSRRRGGQYRYSNKAIEVCLVVRKVYHLALRQTEGFIESFFERIGLNLPAPDYTTLSRRSNGLAVELSALTNKSITDIVVDSTGLKVYGEGEWKVRKYGAGKRRTWMKLHIAIDQCTQQVEAVTLTANSVHDAAEAGNLLKQIKQPVRSFKGDGGYDKNKVRQELYTRKIKQVVPPQHNAVISNGEQDYLQIRDEAIEVIRQTSRAEWKQRNDYHQRSKAETAMFRYKTIIGNTLSSRNIQNQKTEVRIGCKILNITLQTTKPISFKIA
jgi:hypothetical protein